MSIIVKFVLLGVFVLIIPTVFRCVCKVFLAICRALVNLAALFIEIKPCECGEKEICVVDITDRNDGNSGVYLKCQNWNCQNRTEMFPTLWDAKTAWNDGKYMEDDKK